MQTDRKKRLKIDPAPLKSIIREIQKLFQKRFRLLRPVKVKYSSEPPHYHSLFVWRKCHFPSSGQNIFSSPVNNPLSRRLTIFNR